jgi:hypothetical protein
MRPEKGGKIEKVALNKWAHYRSSGYVYVKDGEKKYLEQQAKATPAETEEDDGQAGASKKKKKKVSKKTR